MHDDVLDYFQVPLSESIVDNSRTIMDKKPSLLSRSRLELGIFDASTLVESSLGMPTKAGFRCHSMKAFRELIERASNILTAR